jgi:hypothetical protein
MEGSLNADGTYSLTGSAGVNVGIFSGRIEVNLTQATTSLKFVGKAEVPYVDPCGTTKRVCSGPVLNLICKTVCKPLDKIRTTSINQSIGWDGKLCAVEHCVDL